METSTRFRRTEQDKHASKGAGMFGGAGLVALRAGLLLVAAILALSGKKELAEAGPPVPEQAIESVQRDIDTVKARARS